MRGFWGNNPKQEQIEYMPATFTIQYSPSCRSVTTSKNFEKVEESQPSERQGQI